MSARAAFAMCVSGFFVSLFFLFQLPYPHVAAVNVSQVAYSGAVTDLLKACVDGMCRLAMASAAAFDEATADDQKRFRRAIIGKRISMQCS